MQYPLPPARGPLQRLLGMLVLVITLLKAISSKGRSVGQAADCWQWRG